MSAKLCSLGGVGEGVGMGVGVGVMGYETGCGWMWMRYEMDVAARAVRDWIGVGMPVLVGLIAQSKGWMSVCWGRTSRWRVRMDGAPTSSELNPLWSDCIRAVTKIRRAGDGMRMAMEKGGKEGQSW